MRVFINLEALATFDVDQVQKAFDHAITFDDTDSTTAAVESSRLVNLAANEGPVAFDFGSVTAASLLLVVAYQEVSLQIDDVTAPLVPVRPIPAFPPAGILSRYQRVAQPGLVLWRGKVSSLFLTNPNATAASAFVAVVGNAT